VVPAVPLVATVVVEAAAVVPALVLALVPAVVAVQLLPAPDFRNIAKDISRCDIVRDKLRTVVHKRTAVFRSNYRLVRNCKRRYVPTVYRART